MPEFHTESSPAANGQEAPFSFFLPAGLQLGKYEIVNAIGQGGFGITYLAINTETKKQVVIKENFSTVFSYRHMQNLSVSPLTPGMQETYAKVLRRFMEEAQLLARLHHPNIVPVTTAFKALGTAYYVMPHINGKDLKQSAPPPSDITAKWLIPVLNKILLALKYLHGEGLVHRDIKPENILMQPNGEPMLIDFGTARNQQCTHTMTRMSTPGYTPFEQITLKGNVGPWTDFYALGATCYRLITGECPDESMARMLGDSYTPLAKRPELQHRFPVHVLKSIDKALALHPKQRWQRADEWINALSTDIVPLTLPPAEEQSIHYIPTATSLKPKKAPAKGGWSKFRIIITIIFTLSCLSAAGYFIRTSHEHSSLTLEQEQALPPSEVNKENTPAPSADAQPTGTQEAQSAPETSSSELTQEAAAQKLREMGILPFEYAQALCSAAENGNLEQLQYLITAGADVNTNIQNSNTPLHIAVLKGNHECVRALLAAENIQPDITNCEGKTPLMIACCNGDAVSTELLLATGKVNPNAVDYQGDYLLPMTAYHGHAQCVQQLINIPGVDVNICAASGETALFKAVSQAHADVVQVLLSVPGVDVNRSDETNNNTPILIASASGNIECMRYLLACPQVDVNKANVNGLSPVIATCIAGHQEALRLLLERQETNVNAHMNNGLSALMASVGSGRIECLNLLLSREDIEVNDVASQGISPLLVAAAMGKTECLQVLLQVPGINVNIRHNDGLTALHGAVSANQNESLKILLEHPNIDANATGENGQTALHIAVFKGYTDCVRTLLEHRGININAQLDNGLTPLRLAEQIGQSECARLVREAGGR